MGDFVCPGPAWRRAGKVLDLTAVCLATVAILEPDTKAFAYGRSVRSQGASRVRMKSFGPCRNCFELWAPGRPGPPSVRSTCHRIHIRNH